MVVGSGRLISGFVGSRSRIKVCSVAVIAGADAGRRQRIGVFCILCVELEEIGFPEFDELDSMSAQRYFYSISTCPWHTSF